MFIVEKAPGPCCASTARGKLPGRRWAMAQGVPWIGLRGGQRDGPLGQPDGPRRVVEARPIRRHEEPGQLGKAARGTAFGDQAIAVPAIVPEGPVGLRVPAGRSQYGGEFGVVVRQGPTVLVVDVREPLDPLAEGLDHVGATLDVGLQESSEPEVGIPLSATGPPGIEAGLASEIPVLGLHRLEPVPYFSAAL